MGVVYNRVQQKNLRKHLRNNATNAERLLWESLKGSKLFGFKFRRQHGVGRYVVDFYCPAKKVAIEIDGDTHWTAKEQLHDRKRQQVVENFGIHVLRFTNDDIYKNRHGVLDMILNVLEGREDELLYRLLFALMTTPFIPLLI